MLAFAVLVLSYPFIVDGQDTMNGQPPTTKYDDDVFLDAACAVLLPESPPSTPASATFGIAPAKHDVDSTTTKKYFSSDDFITPSPQDIPLPVSPPQTPATAPFRAQSSTFFRADLHQNDTTSSTSHSTRDTTVEDASEPDHFSTKSPPPKPKPQKRARHNRVPSFSVFLDADVPDSPPKPAPKKQKAGRNPLGSRSTNSAPPMPIDPSLPFSFRPDDPNFEESENFAHRFRAAPPSTSIPRPAPNRPRRAPPRPSRMNPARPAASPRPQPGPVCMELYNLLELEDWKVTGEEIKAAYKKVAVKYHPDKVIEEERDAATAYMQHINAAKEVLMDPARRMAYDRTGKLPWAL